MVRATSVFPGRMANRLHQAGGRPNLVRPKGDAVTPQFTSSALCRVLARIIFAAAVLLSSSTAGFAGQTEAPGSKAVGTNLRKNCGKLSETEFVQSNTAQSTNSTSFVNVVGSNVSFVQGG